MGTRKAILQVLSMGKYSHRGRTPKERGRNPCERGRDPCEGGRIPRCEERDSKNKGGHPKEGV